MGTFLLKRCQQIIANTRAGKWEICLAHCKARNHSTFVPRESFWSIPSVCWKKWSTLKHRLCKQFRPMSIWHLYCRAAGGLAATLHPRMIHRCSESVLFPTAVPHLHELIAVFTICLKSYWIWIEHDRIRCMCVFGNLKLLCFKWMWSVPCQ